MTKPGSVPGPVKVKPNKKSDLTDFRSAKRLQDYLNHEMVKMGPERWSIGWAEIGVDTEPDSVGAPKPEPPPE